MATTSRPLESYARWIDSLHVWPTPVDDLVAAIRTGVLLCRLVEHLVQVREEDPRYTLRGVNAKPRSKTPCIQNIELGLGVLWKQRVVARNMPSAERVYAGDASAVANLMRELFTALALVPANQRPMLEWFDDVLRHYDMELPETVLVSPHRGISQAFRGGDALACVLHFFCG